MIIELIIMLIKAFVVGGGICTIAQLLINYTKITSGKILVYFLIDAYCLTEFCYFLLNINPNQP